MDNVDLINIAINAGTGGVLLFLYIRLEQRFDALQKQLHETNMRMWALLERELANDTSITESQVRRYNPPPVNPSP